MWNTVKIEENCKIRSIYIISNSQTLKIKISVVRYPNFVMKIFSETSNDSPFDDGFIIFFGWLYTDIFIVEVYKFTFNTYHNASHRQAQICKLRSIYMISNSQTLKIKLSVFRYPNFVMKIFSESSNDSLFDDGFIRFCRYVLANIFNFEVTKYWFKTCETL